MGSDVIDARAAASAQVLGRLHVVLPFKRSRVNLKSSSPRCVCENVGSIRGGSMAGEVSSSHLLRGVGSPGTRVVRFGGLGVWAKVAPPLKVASAKSIFDLVGDRNLG